MKALLFTLQNKGLMIYLVIISFIMIWINYNSNSLLYKIANSFTLLAGFYFLYFNFTKIKLLMKEKKWKQVLLQNLLPLVVTYFISVVLYLVYLTSLGEGSFKLKHIFMSSYPYKSNITLILLYVAGLILGQFQKRVVIKVAKGIAITSVIGVICFFVYKNLFSPSKITDIHILEGKYSSIEEIITSDQFKDKTVYVDLWFSNCADCIDQMKNHLPILKKELNQSNLNVAYLYLGKETSAPLSKERWWRAIRKQNLKGWHYYIEKTYEKQFWTTILPTLKEKGKRPFGYPQYLIAKNGKIVDYDAPYPEEYEKVKEIMTKKFAGL